jgi:hypothetical protein
VVGKKEKEKPGSLRLPGFEIGGWIRSASVTLFDPQTQLTQEVGFIFISCSL